MCLQINVSDGDDFLAAFAQTVGSPVENGRVAIPHQYGSGYVMGFLFGRHLRLIVRHYTLHNEVLIKRQRVDMQESMIQIAISGILGVLPGPVHGNTPRKPLPSVTISTQRLDAEVHISEGVDFNLIKLAIDPAYLRELLAADVESLVIKTLVDNQQPVVFEELVSLRLQEVVSEMIDVPVPASLQRFFYKVKAEELICCLLMELVQRQDRSLQAINSTDLKALYAIRDKLIGNLVETPPLGELAQLAGMSLSKLKRLFRQVFGCGPHGYHQRMRIKEAASLLQAKPLSVSEVGFALGFTNLSHFSRVFEKHMGVKPKRFSVLYQQRNELR